MRQRRGLGQARVERGRWCHDRGTQGAIQGVAGGGVIVALHHQLHAAAAGTHQVHGLGAHHGRGHRYADRQHKPHQHTAGEEDGVAQVLHGEGF